MDLESEIVFSEDEECFIMMSIKCCIYLWCADILLILMNV